MKKLFLFIYELLHLMDRTAREKTRKMERQEIRSEHEAGQIQF